MSMFSRLDARDQLTADEGVQKVPALSCFLIRVLQMPRLSTKLL
jgi:hypothetical protein